MRGDGRGGPRRGPAQVCRSCKYRCARQVRALPDRWLCLPLGELHSSRQAPPPPLALPAPPPHTDANCIAPPSQVHNRPPPAPLPCLDSTRMKHSTQRQIKKYSGMVFLCACACVKDTFTGRPPIYWHASDSFYVFVLIWSLSLRAVGRGLLPAR